MNRARQPFALVSPFRLLSPIAQWLDRRQPHERLVMVGLAVTVGILGGLGTILFHIAVETTTELFFGEVQPRLAALGLGPYAVALIPAIGGLIVGLWGARFGRREALHGVAAIMERVALGGGRLDIRQAFVRVVGAVITLGSGGSAGPEDPSVQIGANIGSAIGQNLRLSDDRVKTLVGCGAAAGVASAFNAPIAGGFFAAEIILGQFQGLGFSMVVLSAAVSAAVTQAILGRAAIFSIPPYDFVSYRELVFFPLLGFLAALASIYYVQSISRVGDLLHAWRVPLPVRATAGGAFVGIIGVWLPQVLGTGYPTLTALLQGREFPLLVLLALLVFKPLATAVTLGSGGMGGVFAPSIFVGAVLGFVFGEFVHTLFPAFTALPAVYAMAGMAAVLAASVRAPITAILLLFEMTHDYRVIVPVMLATFVCVVVADLLGHEGIYHLNLLKHGIRIEHGYDVDILQGVLVGEVMDTQVPAISETATLAELRNFLLASHHHGLVVLNREGELVGVVTLQDLERAMSQEGWENRQVAEIMSRDVLVAYPDEPVGVALRRMGSRDIGRLPVVDRRNPRRVIGLVRRSDITKAYQLAILRREELLERAERFRLQRADGVEFLELMVEPGAPVAGHRISDLVLPPNCLLLTRRREGQRQVLHGDDVLQPGDVVVALVEPPEAEQVQRLFRAPNGAKGGK